MHAVIQCAGKQYRVSEGDAIKVEQMGCEVGEKVEINEVLIVCDDGSFEVGTPLVRNAKVVAEVLGHGRGEKVITYKYRRRKNSHNKKGHRQNYTELRIESIKR